MKFLKQWLPALAMMAIIFAFSSVPSEEMPRFGLMDYLVKKSGHALGYALLAAAYLRGLGAGRGRLAWLLALVYALTDEFHQSFVPGRNPSLMDVLIFDNLGAILGLWTFNYFARRKSTGRLPSSPRPPS